MIGVWLFGSLLSQHMIEQHRENPNFTTPYKNQKSLVAESGFQL